MTQEQLEALIELRRLASYLVNEAEACESLPYRLAEIIVRLGDAQSACYQFIDKLKADEA